MSVWLPKGHDARQFMQKQFTVNARAPNDNTCVSRASTNQHLLRGVDIEDAENIMTAGGFSNFEALEKFRWKQDSGYVFKAVRSDPQDVFTIISVGPQDRRQRKQESKPIVNLPGQRKTKFHHNADATVPPTILDTQEDDEDKAMEAPDAVTGKRSAPVKEAQAKKARSGKDSLKVSLLGYLPCASSANGGPTILPMSTNLNVPGLT